MGYEKLEVRIETIVISGGERFSNINILLLAKI